jgi:hypothetical protein
VSLHINHILNLFSQSEMRQFTVMLYGFFFQNTYFRDKVDER